MFALFAAIHIYVEGISLVSEILTVPPVHIEAAEALVIIGRAPAAPIVKVKTLPPDWQPNPFITFKVPL